MTHIIKIALLHLLLQPGELEHNRRLIEQGVKLAASQQADWIITPELAVSGLQFPGKIGTGWITPQPDPWMLKFLQLVKSLQADVFLGCPEKGENGSLYNTVFYINRQGRLAGKQRKVTVTDRWSSSGDMVAPITVDQVKVGVLICSDSYPPQHAAALSAQKASLLLAPSSWGPGFHGPEGEWEQRSRETRLPLFVCNRTGEEETLNYWGAESLVIKDGNRLLSHQSEQSALLAFQWDLEAMDLISPGFKITWIR